MTVDSVAGWRDETERGRFEEALRHKPTDINEYLQYAKWEIKQNQLLRAVDILDRCIAACPQAVEPWLAKIEIQHKQNQNIAEVTALAATKQFPLDDKIWDLALKVCTDVMNVRDLYSQWCDRDPSKLGAFIKYERSRGDHQVVAELYEHWTEVDPSCTEGWLGHIHSQTDRITKINLYPQAMNELFFIKHAQLPQDRTLIVIEYAWVNQDMDETIAVLRKLLTVELEPLEDIIISRELARLQSRGFGVLTKQERAAKYSVRNQPWRLIDLFQENGGRNEIDFGYEYLLSQVPGPQAAAEEWEQYNWVALNYCLEQQSLHSYNRSIALSPVFFPPFYVHKAKLLVGLSQPQDALRELKVAQEYEQSSAILNFQIALAYKLNNLEYGREAYQLYLADQPLDGAAWRLAASFEARIGTLQSMRALFEVALEQVRAAEPREELYKAWAYIEMDKGTAQTTEVVVTRWFDEFKSAEVWREVAYLRDHVRNGDARTVFNQAQQLLSGEERQRLLQSWLSFENKQGFPEAIKRVERLIAGKADISFLSDNPAPVVERAEPQKKLSLFEKAQRWKSS